MTIDDLMFSRSGCCGEYLSAQLAVDGINITVFDDGDAGFRVIQTKDGVSVKPPAIGLSRSGVNALLAAS